MPDTPANFRIAIVDDEVAVRTALRRLLQSAGFEVVGVDNFVNSSPEVLPRLHKLGGVKPVFEQIDVLDQTALDGVFRRHQVGAVIHFAALKAVGESSAKPLDYYQNNLGSLMSLARVMGEHAVSQLVFSSSATVYGTPEQLPLRESSPLSSTSPYGSTKLMAETILRDLVLARPDWSVATLRYFNPVGAHESGLLGEAPNGIPNNLMPYITQVALGQRAHLQIFGNDYDTPDGTGVRDYLHVSDLAAGHLAALRALNEPKLLTVNLGTGQGYSVLEVVQAFERASGRPVPYRIVPRRPGDIAACYADPAQAKTHFADSLRLRAEMGKIDPKDTQAQFELLKVLAPARLLKRARRALEKHLDCFDALRDTLDHLVGREIVGLVVQLEQHLVEPIGFRRGHVLQPIAHDALLVPKPASNLSVVRMGATIRQFCILKNTFCIIIIH